MSRAGAIHELEFVDEPPAPIRTVRFPRADLELVDDPSPPPARYVAPDSDRAHGSHVKYVVERCRCEPCRSANRDYKTRRQAALKSPDQVWAPYVPAGRARQHLAELAAAGVGIKTVADVTGLSHGTLSRLVYGDPQRGRPPSRRIRPSTARRILAVTTAAAEGAQKIPAGPTWKLLDELIARGFTKTWLATQLAGEPKTSLQIRRSRVHASTARRVEVLYERLRGVDPPPRRHRWSR